MKGRLPGMGLMKLAASKGSLPAFAPTRPKLTDKELNLVGPVGRFVLGVVLALLLPGCASYHYFITEPSNLAQQVPEKPVRLERSPLGYQFSETDKRLAIAVSNPTDNAVAINDKKSFIVDPAGQTHPIKAGNIAPRSYITFILPPEERVVRASPAFGFGVGVGHVGYPLSSTAGFYSPLYGPHSYYYHDESETPIWRWKEGPVRLRLSFDAQGSTTNSFEQDWTFERRKIK
jgi:hypothetical protein